LIKATLIGVLAQRLVRTLCRHCKAPASITAAQWRELGVTTDLATLRQLAARGGMRSLRLTGAEKVALGLTSLAEVIALTPDPRQDG
jgi:general secretion pathway protein E